MTENNIYNCNVYQYNASTDGDRVNYGFFILDRSDDNTISWPIDSEINNNFIYGQGALQNLFFFSHGNIQNRLDRMGTKFAHLWNDVSVPLEEGVYR